LNQPTSYRQRQVIHPHPQTGATSSKLAASKASAPNFSINTAPQSTTPPSLPDPWAHPNPFELPHRGPAGTVAVTPTPSQRRLRDPEPQQETAAAVVAVAAAD